MTIAGCDASAAGGVDALLLFVDGVSLVSTAACHDRTSLTTGFVTDADADPDADVCTRGAGEWEWEPGVGKGRGGRGGREGGGGSGLVCFSWGLTSNAQQRAGNQLNFKLG